MVPEFELNSSRILYGSRLKQSTVIFWMFGLMAGILMSLAAPSVAFAKTKNIEILRIRHFTGPDHTRVVLDLSEPAEFDVRRVIDPERLAINVKRGKFKNTEPIYVEDGVLKKIRNNAGTTRAQVVLDLVGKKRFNSFALPAANGRPARIVIDVFRQQELTTPKPSAERLTNIARRTKPYTIILDPGHGGLDPGAIRSGLQEKDLVLDIAKNAAKLINSLPGYRAVLTRSTDYYPSLARRVEIASEKKGDLFVSIHCNTHRQASVSGAEVYFLSLQGATDSQAQELADSENAADLVGLDPAHRPGDSVLRILMDLRMTQLLHESASLSDKILGSMESLSPVHARRVKQAQFAVLGSLAMPSALVEVAYMSNKQDRKVLNSRSGREQLADSLVDGIINWRNDKTALAQLVKRRPRDWSQKYKVKRGDSLWKLAKQYNTTVIAITKQNNLQSGAINVGQLLSLPEGYQSP